MSFLLGCLACSPRAVTPAHPAPAAAATEPAPGARWLPRGAVSLRRAGTDEGAALYLHGGLRLRVAPGRLAESSPWLLPEGTEPARVPAHLGGGHLLRAGSKLWASQEWLAEPRALYNFSSSPRLLFGLRGAVALLSSRPAFGFDPREGRAVDDPGLPLGPALIDLVAHDARHAAANVDAMGVLFTEDAGQHWQPLETTRTASTLRLHRGGYTVLTKNSTDALATNLSFDREGNVRGSTPASAASEPTERIAVDAAWTDLLIHGARDPRSGQLAAVVAGELVLYDATGRHLSSRPVTDRLALCRPVQLSDRRLGFTCTSAAQTELLVLHDGALRSSFRLPGARRSWSSPGGSLAFSGSCTVEAPDSVCVLGGASPRTVQLDHAADDDLLASTRDGRVVVLRPPREGLAAGLFVEPGAGQPARTLTLTAKYRLDAAVTSHLEKGRWLSPLQVQGDGYAVWVELRGRLLGVRIDAQGHFEAGPLSSAGTLAYTAGAHALILGKSGGLESNDHGKSYHAVPSPGDATTPSAGAATPPMGCTEMGCALPGYLRIGWGESPPLASSFLPLDERRQPARVPLQCEVAAPPIAPYAEVAPNARGTRAATANRRFPFAVHLSAARPKAADEGFGGPAPTPGEGQQLFGFSAFNLGERTGRGHVFLWGDTGIDRKTPVSWQWRWLSPDSGSVRIVRSASGTAPSETFPWLGGGPPTSLHNAFALVAAPNGSRALGVLRNDAGNTGTTLLALADGDAPEPVERADGTRGFPELEGAAIGNLGRIVVTASSGDPATTVVFSGDGRRLTEVARLPRASLQRRPPPTHVALHDDGQRAAVLIADDDLPSRSDVAFYLREVEPALGPMRRFALGENGELQPCRAEHGPGFSANVPLTIPGSAQLGQHTVTLTPARGTLHFGDDGSLCLRVLSAGIDQQGAEILKSSAPRTSKELRGTPVTVNYDNHLWPLRCSAVLSSMHE